MILTLTINPAIDRTVMVDRLVFEDRAYILDRAEDAGGRGVNASGVLSCFGVDTAAVLTAGGEAGAKIQKYLRKRGFPSEIVPIAKESRTNLIISDKQGLTIKLNEAGPALEPGEVKRLRAAVEKRMEGASWMMICGSVPPGVPPDIYGDLIEIASKRGVKTLLDADGEAFARGIEAKPTVVTPNHQEAERLLSRALITRDQFLDAVQRIKMMGAKTVLLSLGARGAIAADGREIVEAVPPRVDALTPIGAGDALAAVFVWAQYKRKSFSDSVKWAVAAGTASAVLPGLTMANFEQTREMAKRVELRPAR